MRHPTAHVQWLLPRLLVALMAALLISMAPARAAESPPLLSQGQRVELAPSLAVTVALLGSMTGCASLPDCDLKSVEAVIQVEADGKKSSFRVSALGRAPMGVEIHNGDYRVTIDDVIVNARQPIRLQLGVEEIQRPSLSDWTQMRRRDPSGVVFYANLEGATEQVLGNGQRYQSLDKLFPDGFADGDWLMVHCLTYDLAGERVDIHEFCNGIPNRERLENLPEPMQGLLRAVSGGSEFRFLLTSGEDATPRRPLVLELAVLSKQRY